MKKPSGTRSRRNTVEVTSKVFRQVYDSPASLPGRHKWVTPEEDVRAIEQLLGMKAGTIGAPLWLSGDTQHCPDCSRLTSWLDIVSSALKSVHGHALIVEVILGERKFVNVEVPHAIEHLTCCGCGRGIPDLRSFKCHNWAYAHGDLLKITRGLKGTS